MRPHRNHNLRVKALTLGLIAGLGGMIYLRGRGGVPEAAIEERKGPAAEDAVYGMFDAARAGDTAWYLENFAGPLREELERTAAEMGRERFAAYLKERFAGVKGIAIDEPKEMGGGVEARVEFVYADRNEAQRVYLEKLGGRWRIARLERSEFVKPAVPYGTPAQ